jgi:hypothetical protein
MKDAELQLVVAACRANFDERGGEAAAPTGQKPDWGRFLALSRRHRVQALCWHGLRALHWELPAAVDEPLHRDTDAIVTTNLRMAAESNRLLGIFEDGQIPLLFIKGLTLGAIAYRDPFRKMSWDIDLLVGPDRLADALRLLRAAGYQSIVPSSGSDAGFKRWHERRKESVWRHSSGRFHIDLHTRLADHAALVPGLGIDSPIQIVDVAPGIRLPTLAEDELFAYLCVHGASSAWFRLKWIADLAALLHGKGIAEVERLYGASQRFGAGRAAGQALLIADGLFGIELGGDLRTVLRSDPVNRWLVSSAWGEIAKPAEPTATFLGTANIHLTQLGLLPGWRFKLSEAARQLRNLAD